MSVCLFCFPSQVQPTVKGLLDSELTAGPCSSSTRGLRISEVVFLWPFVVDFIVCILQLCYLHQINTVRKKETFSHDKWYTFQQQPPPLGHGVVSTAGINANLASLLVFMFCPSLGIVLEQASFLKY